MTQAVPQSQVGSDCPDHATYVDVTSSIDRGSTGTEAGALCLFEDDLSETAWRHTNTGGEYHWVCVHHHPSVTVVFQPHWRTIRHRESP